MWPQHKILSVTKMLYFYWFLAVCVWRGYIIRINKAYSNRTFFNTDFSLSLCRFHKGTSLLRTNKITETRTPASYIRVGLPQVHIYIPLQRRNQNPSSSSDMKVGWAGFKKSAFFFFLSFRNLLWTVRGTSQSPPITQFTWPTSRPKISPAEKFAFLIGCSIQTSLPKTLKLGTAGHMEGERSCVLMEEIIGQVNEKSAVLIH